MALGVERGFGQPESRRLSLRCREHAMRKVPLLWNHLVNHFFYLVFLYPTSISPGFIVEIILNAAAAVQNKVTGWFLPSTQYQLDCHSQGAIRSSRLHMACTLGVLEVPVNGLVPLRAVAEAGYRRVPARRRSQWCDGTLLSHVSVCVAGFRGQFSRGGGCNHDEWR